LVAYYV